MIPLLQDYIFLAHVYMAILQRYYEENNNVRIVIIIVVTVTFVNCKWPYQIH